MLFRSEEARELAPTYSPQTVCTDGWEGTQSAWRRLFPTVCIILCFLHSVLKIAKRCGFDAAGFPQGNNEVPAFVGDGLLDLFVVIAAIGQHQDLTLIIRANRVLQVQRTQGGHHALLFALIGQTMRLTIPLALEGNRLQGNQYVTQEQDDIGPLMTNDIPFAVIERFGVFRVQTGPVL